MRLTSDADTAGRITTVTIENGRQPLLTVSYVDDAIEIDGVAIPVALFRRFLRTGFSLLNDHTREEKA